MTPEELSKLSTEEKRARIAEACGIVPCGKWVPFNAYSVMKGDCGHERCYPKGSPPRYDSNLDAMHEAENHRWTGDLNKLFNDASLYREWNYYEQLLHKNINSSASKRADAFLLTVC